MNEANLNDNLFNDAGLSGHTLYWDHECVKSNLLTSALHRNQDQLYFRMTSDQLFGEECGQIKINQRRFLLMQTH